jgi:hypothetical protein
MDLYPEIAVALGEIREGLAARLIGALMGWCYRQTTQVVVLDQHMAARVRKHGVEPRIVRPWVFASVLKQLGSACGKPETEWTWIYSGNLGRAHEWATLLEAQAEVERRGVPIRLLFQGGGPSRPAAEARAREMNLRRVEWRDYVPEEDLVASLLRGHAQVVTQLPAAQGLLWPSKLGLVISLPRAIAWVGPTDGAIARLLRPFPHAAAFVPGDSAALADWLIARQAFDPVLEGKVFDAAAHREASLAAFVSLIAAERNASP